MNSCRLLCCLPRGTADIRRRLRFLVRSCDDSRFLTTRYPTTTARAVDKVMSQRRWRTELQLLSAFHNKSGSEVNTHGRGTQTTDERIEVGGFELLNKTEAEDGSVPVEIYRSSKTGMTVAIARKEGPVVSGRFVVATRAYNDDGLPHVLEHLVFVGSEKYPWKGALMNLISRCRGHAADPVTMLDHTSFGLDTAGCEGFCNALAAYLDHILYPTLPLSAYITEVHHVTADGGDGGVVYAELEARENRDLAFDTTEIDIRRVLYPGDGSGYAFNPGGTTEALRDSMSIGKVRDYHAEFYRPENVWLLVIGNVDSARILKCLEPVEDKVISKGKGNGREPKQTLRPWLEDPPPLTESVRLLPPLRPDEDFNAYCSYVSVSWRGPSLLREMERFSALQALLQYVTHRTPENPLFQTLVTGDKPSASNLWHTVLPLASTGFGLHFERVRLAGIDELLAALWQAVSEMSLESNFDLPRMRSILESRFMRERLAREAEPHKDLASRLTMAMLYGSSPKDIDWILRPDRQNLQLTKMDAKFWVSLLEEYLNEHRPCVIVPGMRRIQVRADSKVSAQNVKELRLSKRDMEESIVEWGQQRKLELESAIFENQRKPDGWEKLMTSIPPPSPKNIAFYQFKSYANFEVPERTEGGLGILCRSQAPNFNLDCLPVRMRVGDVAADFVQLQVLFDTSGLDPELRLCLPLYLKKLLPRVPPLILPLGMEWSPDDLQSKTLITRNFEGRQCVPREAVAEVLQRDTVELRFMSGFGSFKDYVGISIKVEMHKYEAGVKCLRDLIYYATINPATLLLAMKEMGEDLAVSNLNTPEFVLAALVDDMTGVTGSNTWAALPIRQLRVLGAAFDRVKSLLEEGEILQAYEAGPLPNWLKLQKYLQENTQGMIIHMVADLDKLHESLGKGWSLEKPWMDHFVPQFGEEKIRARAEGGGGCDPSRKPLWDAGEVSFYPDHMNVHDGTYNPRMACAVGMKNLDHAQMCLVSPTDIKSCRHPDCLPLMLFLEYLMQVEGPIFQATRGRGLSCPGDLRLNFDDGHLTLHLGPSNQVVDCYKATIDAINKHLGANASIDPILLESAKGSMIYKIVSQERTIPDLANLAVLATLRRIPVDYFRNLVGTRIPLLSGEQILRSGRKYLPALLDPSKSHCAIVCPEDQVNGISTAFSQMGRSTVPFRSVWESILNYG